MSRAVCVWCSVGGSPASTRGPFFFLFCFLYTSSPFRFATTVLQLQLSLFCALAYSISRTHRTFRCLMSQSEHQLQKNVVFVAYVLPPLGTPAMCETHVQQIDCFQGLPELDDPQQTNGLGGDPRVSIGFSVRSQVCFSFVRLRANAW